MTSYATNITPLAAPTRTRTGPILTTITGSILGFIALLLLAGGIAAFSIDDERTDGYFTSATHTFSSPTRALTTQSLDIDTDAPDWLFSTDTFGHIRIDPRSTDAAQPVFVGIAPTGDVNAYLDQVPHDEITDVDLDPFTIDRSRHAGEARPALPAAQTFWAASSVDGRPLDWKVRSGEWSVVMMNADASPGVSVDASVGADAPFIRDLAWWLTIPGLGLGLIALTLIAAGVRGLTRSGARPAVASAPASA